MTKEEMDRRTGACLMAAMNTLHAAGVSPGAASAKSFTYDHDGSEETGVEVTLLYSQPEAQGIEARQGGDVEQAPREAREPGPEGMRPKGRFV